MAEEQTVTLKQEKGDELAIRHRGEMAVYGSEKQAAIQHVIHSSEEKPIVHMVCWDAEEPCTMDIKGRLMLVGDTKAPIRLQIVQEQPCAVDLGGRVTVAGDEKSPLRLQMSHTFDNPHVQEHKVVSKLAEPIHHALQLRTPLELRFCNPWHIASDYQVELKLADNRLLSVRLTGATVASPQLCADEKLCSPAPGIPTHP